MKKDKYFNCMAIERKHIQTQGHLTTVRELSDLLPTPEEVEQVFAMHELAMSKMLALCGRFENVCCRVQGYFKGFGEGPGVGEKSSRSRAKKTSEKGDCR